MARLDLFSSQLPPPSPSSSNSGPNLEEQSCQLPIQGLKLTENFLTENEHDFLVRLFESNLHQFGSAASSLSSNPPNTSLTIAAAPSKQRQSLHFGPKFDYSLFASLPTVEHEFPPWLRTITERCGKGQEWYQATLQYYPAGSGIPPHIDTHSVFGPEFGSLSFGSSVSMDFRPAGKREEEKVKMNVKRCLTDDDSAAAASILAQIEHEHDRISVELPARSLVILSGQVRYAATHGIRQKNIDVGGWKRRERWSITFRQTRAATEECACRSAAENSEAAGENDWHRWCDQQKT